MFYVLNLSREARFEELTTRMEPSVQQTEFCELSCVSGREGGIRTRDLSVPNRARYQASLLPDVLNSLLDVPCTRFLGPEPSRNSLNCSRIARISPSA